MFGRISVLAAAMAVCYAIINVLNQNLQEDEQASQPRNIQNRDLQTSQPRGVQASQPHSIQASQNRNFQTASPRHLQYSEEEENIEEEYSEEEEDYSEEEEYREKCPLPPRLGLEGQWIPRQYFKGKKSFGYYKCSKCSRTWGSAHSFPDSRQACKSCETWNFPIFMWKNFTKDTRSRKSDDDDGPPHEHSRCEKCLKGNMCTRSKGVHYH